VPRDNRTGEMAGQQPVPVKLMLRPSVKRIQVIIEHVAIAES